MSFFTVAFFESNFSISFWSSSWLVKVKENFSSNVMYYLIFKMLGCISYFIIIFSIILLGLIVFTFVGVNNSICKSSIVSMKKLFIFSATSFSLVITSSFSIKINSFCIIFCLCEKSGLTRCQNFLLSLKIFVSRLL